MAAILPPSGPESQLTPKQEANTPVFMGSTSLRAHTAFVNKLLKERVLGSTDFDDLAPQMQAAISTLEHTVSDQNTLGVTFSLLCCFMTIDDSIKHCNKVCFAIEGFNLTDYIIVNGGLYYLFNEKAHNINIGAEKASYVQYHTMCKSNLELALSNLGFFMDSSKENIAALLFGVIYAIEISRPLLALKMNHSAIQMCETLGYHRLPMSAGISNYDTQLSSESNLFWYAYMIDKGLALRLGRSSAIRDQDITIPVIASSSSLINPSEQFFNSWVRHSKVQGRIYDELYSFTALSSTHAERMQRGLVLAEEVKSLIQVTTDLLPNVTCKENAGKYQLDGVNSLEVSSKSEIVTLHATLTLIYRAVRTLIVTPFIPFIIIFCHAAESSSDIDLHLLREFVQSLQGIRNVSEAIDQLLSLAEVLLHIAVLCKEANRENAEVQQSLLIGPEFELYFSQCGFMPPLFDEMTFREGLGGS
ncbi:hypothetical protein UA08_07054 [Talaromyces atroroseus]|uniref:Xylanolytic transcriptional activator regulatory domain-containing protein n=1 Tax=Talaromyces atroroseus TaxID=1441469 RepID=A0A225ARB6_TALAT|nr:hypothetical protein UA08_07054 [Talaromyces atroroseus]OKL57486.1 hypothetical protein UA08_07054 [Talaromyces atroroseus]